jgi:hypothetical protein
LRHVVRRRRFFDRLGLAAGGDPCGEAAEQRARLEAFIVE